MRQLRGVSGLQRLLAERDLRQSMSRKTDYLDNAAMESFLGPLKAELCHLNRFSSIEQLQARIRRYISTITITNASNVN